MIRRMFDYLRSFRRRTPLRGPWFLALALLGGCAHTRAIDAHARACAARISVAPTAEVAREIADQCHEENRGMR